MARLSSEEFTKLKKLFQPRGVNIDNLIARFIRSCSKYADMQYGEDRLILKREKNRTRIGTDERRVAVLARLTTSVKKNGIFVTVAVSRDGEGQEKAPKRDRRRN